jgi:hypothetical protein
MPLDGKPYRPLRITDHINGNGSTEIANEHTHEKRLSRWRNAIWPKHEGGDLW